MAELEEMNLDQEGEESSLKEPTSVPIVPSSTIFGAAGEVVIDHAGERYRLRITRRNRLILSK